MELAESAYSHFEIIQAEALEIIQDNKKVFKIGLSSGKSIQANRVILALGNFPPRHPNSKSLAFIAHSNYFQNPWQEMVFKTGKEATVLIIGTGLSAIDIILGLKESGYDGNICCLSNHGFLPFEHRVVGSYPDFFDSLKGKCLLEMTQIIAHHLRKSGLEGYDWRAVIDSVRPHVQKIWMSLSAVEKQQFLRHLRHKWGAARHRMPPESANVIYSLLSNNKLTVLAGKTLNIQAASNGFEVQYLNRLSHQAETLVVGKIINCTGPESDLTKIDSALVQDLLQKELIQPDSINNGIDANPDGKAKNKFTDCELYAIGPMLKGLLWETTAIPEIREQAENLAMLLSKQ